MTLHLEQLESRDTPSVIDGWPGATTIVYRDMNGDNQAEQVAAAGDGGSARVVVKDGATGVQLANFIAFEDTFRGGAEIQVVGPDIVIVPGPGGGPRVEMYRLGVGVTASYFTPVAPDFRDGMHVGSGPLTFTPHVGPGPWRIYLLAGDEFIAIDPETREVASRFTVGPGWRFEAAGAWSTTAGEHIAITLDRGPIVDWYVQETATFDSITGARL